MINGKAKIAGLLGGVAVVAFLAGTFLPEAINIAKGSVDHQAKLLRLDRLHPDDGRPMVHPGAASEVWRRQHSEQVHPEIDRTLQLLQLQVEAICEATGARCPRDPRSSSP